MENQRFFNRQICAAAQIRSVLAAWTISENNQRFISRRFVPAVYSLQALKKGLVNGMLYVFIVIAFVLTEYKIKNHIENNMQLGEKKDIWGGRITLQKHYNKGAFLNFMEEKKEMVKTVSCICLGLLLLLFTIMLPKKGNKLFKLGLSLVLGGAISNVSDRVLKGYVIDYFSINCKKLKKIVFNLADMVIFLGCFFIMLTSLFPAKGKSCPNKTIE